MKTIFTLFSSLILSLAVMAAAPKDKDARPKSTLTIRSAEAGDIRVVIDGRRFEPSDNFLRIQGIESGYHNVKIYRERNSGFFAILGKRYEMVFSSSLAVKPSTNVMIQVDRFGKPTITESRTKRRFDRDSRNWDSNHDFNFDRGGNFGDYDNGHNGRVDDRDWNDRGYGYSRAMSDVDFSRVRASISKEWFEANRARSASQIIQTNYLTALQVKQLLQMFSFENTKLDLAKQAYTKTVDQKNYFMINEVFSFNSSKDELARYIRSCE